MDAINLLLLARILHHSFYLADFLPLLLQKICVVVLLASQRHEILLLELLTVKYEILHVLLDA